MTKKPPLKVAVIGIGSFGELHCRTLAGLVEAELVAMVNGRPQHAQTLATELDVPNVYESLEELIQKGGAEALVIATRTDTHNALARQALSAGLHVLIEKPVGSNAVEVSGLEVFSRDSGCVAMAGHICLFHSLISPLIERVQNEGWRAAHFVRHRPAETARLFSEEHPFRMTMVHDLYVLGQLAGNEEPISIDGLDAVGASGTIDMSWATLRWVDGRVATLQAHWTLPEGSPSDGWDVTEVFGTGYYARAATNPQNGTWTQQKQEWWPALEISSIGGRPTGMLAEELRSFIAACHGKEVPAGCRLSDALQVQRWVEQLMLSAQEKRA